MFLTAKDMFQSETPFCHIVLPMTILPYLATGELIFPARLSGHFAAVYSMLAIWLIATFTLGRGWCSWVCFYGGWDDGFSRFSRKTRVSVKDPEKRIRYFNFSMLSFVVLASLGTLTAVYCAWLCPFKTVTEFGEVKDASGFFAFIIFILAFFALAVVMPILTRKRTQCMSFCPFGAFQSLADKVSLYRVRIDREKCVDCGICERACPTMSLSPESIKSGKTLLTCTKCGECVSVCPEGAARYEFAWARACGNPEGIFLRIAKRAEGAKRPARFRAAFFRVLDEVVSPRALMVTTGMLIGSIIMGSFATGSIHRFMNFIMTGSFLLK